MNVYVIFGDHSEKISALLSKEFEIAGYERTLESAVVDLQKMLTKPDVLLVLGSAMVTGAIGGTVNYNAALLENLKKLRLILPESRIKILILKDTTDDLVKSIVSLGIYDIYRVDKISVDELPSVILTEKNIANYSDDIPVPKIKASDSNREIEVLDNEEVDHKPFFKLPKFKFALNKAKEQRIIAASPEKVESKGNIDKEEIKVQPPVSKEPSQHNRKHQLKDAIPKIRLSMPFKAINHQPRNVVITVISPWMPNIGTTGLAISLADKLKANIIDADLRGRGLGLRLGISPKNIWEYDWRDGANPVIFKNERYAWTLDPHVENFNNDLSQSMEEIIMQSAGCSLVIDAGSDPMAWYAELVMKKSDAICVTVVADPLQIARAIPRWRKVFVISKPAVIALIGDGDPAEVSEEFGLPVIKLVNATCNASRLAKELINSAQKGTTQPQKTIYLAGPFDPIDIEGINCRIFPDSYNLWKAIETNETPDALIFYAFDGIEQLISELRRDDYKLPIAVIGGTDEKYYTAGTDACYENLTPDCIRDLSTRADQVR